MTKFARKKNYGTVEQPIIRLTEMTDVPNPLPPGFSSNAEWLARFQPTFSADGWYQVADSVINGAVDNGDGTYTNPIVSEPVRDVVHDRTCLMGLLATVFGSAARVGKILKAFSVSDDDELFAAYYQFSEQLVFTKAETISLFTLLREKNVAADDKPLQSEIDSIGQEWNKATGSGIYNIRR